MPEVSADPETSAESDHSHSSPSNITERMTKMRVFRDFAPIGIHFVVPLQLQIRVRAETEAPNTPTDKYINQLMRKFTYLTERILKMLRLGLEDLQLRKLLGLFEYHIERGAAGGRSNCRHGQRSRWLECRRRGGGDGHESKGVEFHTSSCVSIQSSKGGQQKLLLALAEEYPVIERVDVRVRQQLVLDRSSVSSRQWTVLQKNPGSFDGQRKT